MAESQHPVELVFVAPCPPARVIAILLASALIAAGRLQMRAQQRHVARSVEGTGVTLTSFAVDAPMKGMLVASDALSDRKSVV